MYSLYFGQKTSQMKSFEPSIMTPLASFVFQKFWQVQKFTRIIATEILATNSSDRYQKVIEDAIENQL